MLQTLVKYPVQQFYNSFRFCEKYRVTRIKLSFSHLLIFYVFIMDSKILLVMVVAVTALLVIEGKPASNDKAMCKLPAVRGHCRALLPRWRYDPTTGRCQEFKFGGCDGNENNFMSQKACIAICGGIR